MSETAVDTPALSYLRTGPVRYVNRVDALREVGAFARHYGDRAAVMGGRRALRAVQPSLARSLDEFGIAASFSLFAGECCPENIEVVHGQCSEHDATLVIGVGGGKAIDTAKKAAADLGLPVICVPTIAATCAAVTAQSIIYDSRGVFDCAELLPGNPDVVIVDPRVIAHAPVEYLRAGILDSLAKWYEGDAVYRGLTAPDTATRSAMVLSHLLHERHVACAASAIGLVERSTLGDDLVEAIDLSVYLTGLIQSLSRATLRGGIAHAVHNGLTTVAEAHNLLHGIKVGYGIMVQIVAEGYGEKDFSEVLSFFRALGLEPSLSGLHLPADTATIRRVAEMAANDPYVGTMPFTVTPEIVYNAMVQLEQRIGYGAH